MSDAGVVGDAVDLAVIGAGPAGMSAAIAASERGVETLVIDEKPRPGGQIYAGIEAGTQPPVLAAGSDHARGHRLIERFRASAARYRPGSTVWDIAPDGTLHVSDGEKSHRIKARRVVLATGALERPLAFPGWTLPGVVTAGGAQLLLKTGGLVPTGPVVLAGSGPLLLLLAAQYHACGVGIAAILDTTPRSHWRAAARHLPGAVLAGPLAFRGLGLLARIWRARIPVVRGVGALRALGAEHLEAVEYEARGRRLTVEAGLLLIHQGIRPDTHLSRAMLLDHAWDETGHYWRPVARETLAGANRLAACAGDGARVLGARAAEHSGRIAGLDAALGLGAISASAFSDMARASQKALARAAAERRFIDTLYAPPSLFRVPGDAATPACRCEEVSVARIMEEARTTTADINGIKSRLRCGMGACQGRYCEPTVQEIVARTRGIDPRDVGQLRIRPPIKPIAVSELIGLGVAELPVEGALPGYAPAHPAAGDERA